jgi:hypothetical protein
VKPAPCCDHRFADRKKRAKEGSWLDPPGYDAGKKVTGRNRHILVDTLGLLLNVVVHPANVQDRNGAFHLLRQARRLFPHSSRISLPMAAVPDPGWRSSSGAPAPVNRRL